MLTQFKAIVIAIFLLGFTLPSFSEAMKTTGFDEGSLTKFEIENLKPDQISDKSWHNLKQVIYEQQITANDSVNIGVSLSLDPVNNRAVLGATSSATLGTTSGAAFVFVEENGAWVEETKLLAFDGFAYQNFGKSVAIDGDWIAVGAPGTNSIIDGYVYLYQYDGQQWVFFDKLNSAENNLSDFFGHSLRLSNGVLLVNDYHSRNDNLDKTGAAFVFNYDGINDQWSAPIKVQPANTTAFNNVGFYLDMNAMGDRLVLSAEGDSTNGANAGAVYVFDWDGNAWVESEKLIGSNVTTNSAFGNQVAISDDGQIVIARSTFNNGQFQVYVFELINQVWQETAIISDPNVMGSFFATAIDVSNEVIAIGRHSPREIITYTKSANQWISGQTLDASEYVNLIDFDIQGDRFLASNMTKGAVYYENLPSVKSQAKGTLCGLGGCEWSVQGTLLNTPERVDDNFGVSIDASGQWAIIGAHQDDEIADNAGAAYIFTRNSNDKWLQWDKLMALDGAAGDFFGRAVAIDGTRAVVGAYADDLFDSNVNITIPDAGSVYVFERVNNNWVQTQKLIAGEDLLAAGDFFGSAVDIQGDRIVVGARSDDENGTDSGATYVFDYDGNSWSLTQKIMPLDGNAGDAFGYSVALDGNRFISGAYLNDEVATNTGAAYVFEYEPLLLGWLLEDKLMPVFFGSADDYFGTEVALQGDRALVTALRDDVINGSDNSGRVYSFKKEAMSDNWLQTQAFTASDVAASDEFGYSIALDGDRALIGAWREDDGLGTVDNGAAYLFKLNANSGLWTEQKKIREQFYDNEDYFGVSTAISGEQLFVGAHRKDLLNGLAIESNAGAVYVMTDDVIFKDGFE